MKRILLTIFTVWFIGVNLYAAPYAKKDLTVWTTRQLESAIIAINNKDSIKISVDEDIIKVQSSLPPSKDIATLAEQYPAAQSDIIRKLLENAP